MYKCFQCAAVLEVKRFGEDGSSEGLPKTFITHARCTNKTSDCVASRTWLVVNELDNKLLLDFDGNKTVVGI